MANENLIQDPEAKMRTEAVPNLSKVIKTGALVLLDG